MSNTVKWGILSTARINRRIIPPLKQAARSEVIAVASRSMETAQDFAQTWGIERTYASYDALLAASDIDVVYIPLPNGMHHEWAIKAAQAGKHVLCEKPLAMTITQVDQMSQAAQDNSIIMVEALMYQMHPQLTKLKVVIHDGLIGDVKLIRGTFSLTLPERSAKTRLVKAAGGGSLWDLGIYPVSFVNAVAGSQPQTVFASQQMETYDVDVNLTGLLTYGNGIMAQIDCGFGLPYRVGAEVIGTQGLIRIQQPWQPDTDHRSSGLIHIAPDDTETPIHTEPIDPYLCEIQVMERAILDGESVPYTLTHSRANIATINALYASAEQRQAIEIAF